MENHLEDYCLFLESEKPNLEAERICYWVDRHGLALAVKAYSKSDDWTDNQKAEVLRVVLERLPVHEIGIYPPLERKHLRMASKINPDRFNFFRREPYEEAYTEEPEVVAEDLEKRGLTTSNTQAVNRCHIARGPVYSIQLLCSRFPNGETGFSIFFVDENVTVDISESDARLLHRFMNDDRFDVLDCFEEEAVQLLLQRAERKALTRRYRDVPDEDDQEDLP